MKNVIPAIIVGVMVLVLVTSGLAEAKPGVTTVHISAKTTSGQNASNVLCFAFGADSTATTVTGGFIGITNNGGKAHIDIDGEGFSHVIVDCKNYESKFQVVSSKGPTKVTIP